MVSSRRSSSENAPIANEDADCPGDSSFPVRMSREYTAHEAIVDFMCHGQWVSDDDLKEVPGRRVESARAHRRELSNTFGDVIEPRQFSPSTWRYRLIDFPFNPTDGY